MNQKEIKKQFPFFSQNKEIIYFDNNASSLKPSVVIGAENYYNAFISTNAGRGMYNLAYIATKEVEETRDTVANFIHAKSSEIIFTKNTTESLNLVVLSYVANFLKAGDEIVLSVLEHHSLLLPLLEIAKKIQAVVRFIPLTKEHTITIENFKSVLTSKTKIVALTDVSNATGVRIPTKELIALSHQVGAITILDTAQTVPHFEVNVQELDCDFLAFSGYKIGAPTGVGILFGKENLLSKMPPIYFGGGMVADSTCDPIEYKEAPVKFEAGTLPIGQIIGLKSAIQFLEHIGYPAIQKKDRELHSYFIKELSKIKEVEIYNPNADIATILFNIKGIHAHDIATMYDLEHICIRAGHHCVQFLMKELGQISSLRASLYYYNTKSEIDAFIIATKKIIAYFNQIKE